jgi:hypothetical protein
MKKSNARKPAAKEIRTNLTDSRTLRPETPATKEARANVNVYTLSAKAKKIDTKEIKPETHKGACLIALKKLGSAPFAAILTEVLKQKTIKTEMDLSKACRWMIGDMVRKGLVEVKG